ncbi:MAG: type II toxin-antitoxin system HicB family antitoxin [Spirochaetia bacterium]|nr:type II toxin-antitoxin system HicB family antitoxin [Spirochaetia bacterium]
MMKRWLFPACFRHVEGGSWTVDFPDLPGCVTVGDTLEEALSMAREVLSLHLYGMLEDGDTIPQKLRPDPRRSGRARVRGAGGRPARPRARRDPEPLRQEDPAHPRPARRPPDPSTRSPHRARRPLNPSADAASKEWG